MFKKIFFAFRFNNVEHLPFFKLESSNRFFCPKKITLRTETGKVFSRNIANSGLEHWMPMFHESNTNFIKNALLEIGCPEDSNIRRKKESCPKENVRYSSIKEDETRFCAFK